ncbi:hypothetical protein Pmar_PMAR020708 [Perkinsus marinus ATCC 50983]|uniref:RAP domain-containing protein n=1 Tax=Perkinsus marinus (strain ATCC 50983 / TXsc) TaxID=423536 RepID=C5KVW5_PERM5|nr:hypothetical protein Pmar_PMAR020708 [Perkinsus marinus ATCC 50983]EER11356.1 hypothetical protein Pmar_PMAR020708 [Perkinsus marinus ATCC 50983]|eukprot:XP_002779561.1 hypothetical protein Pmar_PMAR020708 [Perkinsus marinus ATCC 50983]
MFWPQQWKRLRTRNIITVSCGRDLSKVFSAMTRMRPLILQKDSAHARVAEDIITSAKNRILGVSKCTVSFTTPQQIAWVAYGLAKLSRSHAEHLQVLAGIFSRLLTDDPNTRLSAKDCGMALEAFKDCDADFLECMSARLGPKIHIYDFSEWKVTWVCLATAILQGRREDMLSRSPDSPSGRALTNIISSVEEHIPLLGPHEVCRLMSSVKRTLESDETSDSLPVSLVEALSKRIIDLREELSIDDIAGLIPGYMSLVYENFKRESLEFMTVVVSSSRSIQELSRLSRFFPELVAHEVTVRAQTTPLASSISGSKSSWMQDPVEARLLGRLCREVSRVQRHASAHTIQKLLSHVPQPQHCLPPTEILAVLARTNLKLEGWTSVEDFSSRLLEEGGEKEFIRHCHARASLGLPIQVDKLREVLRNPSSALTITDKVRCLHSMALANQLSPGDEFAHRILRNIDGGLDDSPTVQQLRLFINSTRTSVAVELDTSCRFKQTALARHVGMCLKRNFPHSNWITHGKISDGNGGSVNVDYWCPEHGSVEVLGPTRHYFQTEELTAAQSFKYRLIRAVLGSTRLRAISYHQWNETQLKQDSLISSLFTA